MPSIRQDAWSEDEDLHLAEVVLRHIREGSTQLAAFEEVAEKLSRSSSACGFRWNSLVRKKYETAITLAKKQRKALQKNKRSKSKLNKLDQKKEEKESVSSKAPVSTNRKIEIDDVIRFLVNVKSSTENEQTLAEENTDLKEKIKNLMEENKQLDVKVKELENEFQTINEEYKTLLGIMERARKMVVLQEDRNDSQVQFKMEHNGNLEKVNK